MESGDVLAGRYRLNEILGEGRIGTVWHARDKQAGQDVAVKIPHLLEERNPEFIARFQRELLTGLRLSHPAIVRSLEAGQDRGVPFLVMELVEGAPIHVWFERMRNFKLLTQVLEDVLDALSYAHVSRVVHQDLKPSNLLVDEEGQVHLCDFGLAGRLEDQTRTGSSGEMLADLAYLSPEQAMGERGGVQSDLYSLGAVLYHLLTGRPPFDADSPASFLLAILNEHPQAPHKVRTDVPAWLSRLTMRLMARQPSLRPHNAGEVLRLVQRHENRGEPVPFQRKPALIGREQEQDELATRVEELREGYGSITRISGTPGVGKSFLVEEFLGGVTDVAICLVAARGLEPLHPGLLEKALGGRGSLADRLQARLAEGPVILVVERFEQATPELVSALAELVGTPEDQPLMVLLTDRPGRALCPAGAEFLNNVYHRLTLRGFTLEQCARYVEDQLWEAAPEEAVAWLHRTTHGNPLHLRVLLRQLEGSYLQVSGGSVSWEEPHDLPHTLPELLAWRMERQGPDSVTLLGMAACLEERFELALLQAVVNYEERVLEDLLEGLVRADLLLEDWDSGGPVFQFAHEQAWRVALDRVPERRQRRICLLAANFLVHRSPVEHARAARFFRRAGQGESAAEQLLLAAARELEAGNWMTAERRLEEALSLTGVPATQARATMLSALLWAGRGQPVRARELAHHVLKLRPDPETARQARVLIQDTPLPRGKTEAAPEKAPAEKRPRPARAAKTQRRAEEPPLGRPPNLAARRAVLGVKPGQPPSSPVLRPPSASPRGNPPAAQAQPAQGPGVQTAGATPGPRPAALAAPSKPPASSKPPAPSRPPGAPDPPAASKPPGPAGATRASQKVADSPTEGSSSKGKAAPPSWVQSQPVAKPAAPPPTPEPSTRVKAPSGSFLAAPGPPQATPGSASTRPLAGSVPPPGPVAAPASQAPASDAEPPAAPGQGSALSPGSFGSASASPRPLPPPSAPPATRPPGRPPHPPQPAAPPAAQQSSSQPQPPATPRPPSPSQSAAPSRPPTGLPRPPAAPPRAPAPSQRPPGEPGAVVAPKASDPSQEPPSQLPSLARDGAEDLETVLRKRFVQARASQDRVQARAAAEELARFYQSVDPAKAALWRRQAQQLGASPAAP